MDAANLLFMGLGSTEISIILLTGLIPLAVTIWALIDVIKSNFDKDVNKIVWIIVILGVPVIGAILYFFIGSRQKSVS